jgi:hypothetical protein
MHNRALWCYCCLSGTRNRIGPVDIKWTRFWHPITPFFSVIQRRLKRHMKKWVWGIDGMIVTGENRITRRKTCASANLSTTNPPPTDLWSSTDLRRGMLKANRRSYSAPQINFTWIAQPWALRHYKPSGDGELLNERQAQHPRRLGSIKTTLWEGQISHIGCMFLDAATRQISTVLCNLFFPSRSQYVTSRKSTEYHKTLWLNYENKRYRLLGCDSFSLIATGRLFGVECLYIQSILFSYQ